MEDKAHREVGMTTVDTTAGPPDRTQVCGADKRLGDLLAVD